MSGHEEKTRILDEFEAVTGFKRKHAMRLLRGGATTRPAAASRPGRRLYDDAVREALVVLWEASDGICSKRLKPLLPTLVDAMERHGHLDLAEGIRCGSLGMRDWFEAEPWRTSRQLLDRLQAECPGRYPDKLLRTLRRRVKVWRHEKVQGLVFGPYGSDSMQPESPTTTAVDSRLAYARLSAVATASHLPTANKGSNNFYTTSWDTTLR